VRSDHVGRFRAEQLLAMQDIKRLLPNSRISWQSPPIATPSHFRRRDASASRRRCVAPS